MMRACSLFLAMSLAGCPAKKSTTPEAAGAGCPTATNVYVASYVTQEAGKGRSGWVLPLHVVPGATGDAAAYASIDGAAAQAAGVSGAPTGTPWLVTAAGAPCRATLGKYYAAKLDGPPAAISYGVELEGCAAPANPDEAGGLVLVSDRAPTGCRFEQPHPIAARLGEMDKNKQWQRPTKETPLPPLTVEHGDKDCVAPACEKLWAFAEVKVDGQPVAWTGAINWLHVGAPDQQCQWQADRESGTWLPTGVRVTEGQEDHALPLSAVLADGDGAKVWLTEGPGVYATYDVQIGRIASSAGTQTSRVATAKLGHKITWQLAPPEAWDAVDHLMFCEPEKH